MSNSTLQNNATDLNEVLALATSLPNQVTDVVKYTTQTLTDEQKTQARTNIGAISASDVITDSVRYSVQELTDEQKTQARENIGAMSREEVITDAVRYNEQTLTDAQKAQARANIGAVSSEDMTTDALPKSGGTMTGALVAASQPINTKTVRNIMASTTDLVDGSSSLETGMIYLVYEA